MPLSPWPKLRSGGNKAADTMHPLDKTKYKPNPRLLLPTNHTMQLCFSFLSCFNTYLQFLVFSTLAVLYVTMVGKSSLFLSSFLRFIFIFPSSFCVGRCVSHFVLFDDDDDDDNDDDDDDDDEDDDDDDELDAFGDVVQRKNRKTEQLFSYLTQKAQRDFEVQEKKLSWRK